MDDAAAPLRAAMVRELRDLDGITSEPVAAAVGTVPRHLFAIGEPLEKVYAPDTPLVIKRNDDGLALSSLSAAHIQAVMLEQAGVEPGMRVLEVGSGGYNAALLAELAGASGEVTTVDIDPDIVARARTCLDEAGYERVRVVRADAEHGVPDGAPYDRIIVTAGAFDIPPAWLDQLAGRGRIVVPLRWRGVTRSIAFDRDGDGGALASSSYRLCGFVPMQGIGAHRELVVPIEDGLFLRVDDRSRHFDTGALAAAARTRPLEAWSGAAYDLPDELELFLLTSTPRAAMLHAGRELIDQGRFDASAGRGVPALVRDGGFAYRIRRVNEATGGFESGVLAHGPQAETIAEEYCDLLRRWATGFRRRGAARIRYIPAALAAAGGAQDLASVKPHGTVTVSWA
ncbi:methyltransferase, FxLD system [Actinomadura craniellae]|uniref:methyltransferase, FxLD system n=1 Tax=Actinomadura craniellae TaxID=2231787 RepID=UPI001F027DD4|nr:methyltransferase, FxLD system [Actinomadura craniellae]